MLGTLPSFCPDVLWLLWAFPTALEDAIAAKKAEKGSVKLDTELDAMTRDLNPFALRAFLRKR